VYNQNISLLLSQGLWSSRWGKTGLLSRKHVRWEGGQYREGERNEIWHQAIEEQPDPWGHHGMNDLPVDLDFLEDRG
jgi:hypothetical protein